LDWEWNLIANSQRTQRARGKLIELLRVLMGTLLSNCGKDHDKQSRLKSLAAWRPKPRTPFTNHFRKKEKVVKGQLLDRGEKPSIRRWNWRVPSPRYLRRVDVNGKKDREKGVRKSSVRRRGREKSSHVATDVISSSKAKNERAHSRESQIYAEKKS